MQDDFLRLGGHSMLLMEMVWRVGERLGVDLTFADVFAEPTLAAVSAHVVRLRSAAVA
jgi:acyl carrier protein